MFLFNVCWHAVFTVLFGVGTARGIIRQPGCLLRAACFNSSVINFYPCTHIIGRAMSCDVWRIRALK